MTSSPIRLSLPLDSLALVGAGSQGTALLSTFGLKSALVETDFDALIAAGQHSSDIRIGGSAAVAALSRQATGWVSVTDTESETLVAIAMPCGDVVLVMVCGPDVILWSATVTTDTLLDELAPTVEDHVVQLAAFVDGTAICSYRVGSSIDAAARDHAALERLAAAATREAAVPALFAEIQRAEIPHEIGDRP